MAQTQTMPVAAFEHERCKPNAACAQKVVPVMNHVATDEDIELSQVPYEVILYFSLRNS